MRPLVSRGHPPPSIEAGYWSRKRRATSVEDTERGEDAQRPVAGWFAMGPMESICIVCAPTAEAVWQLYDPRRWIADVWAIHSDEHATMDEVRCAFCDRLIVK